MLAKLRGRVSGTRMLVVPDTKRDGKRSFRVERVGQVVREQAAPTVPGTDGNPPPSAQEPAYEASAFADDPEPTPEPAEPVQAPLWSEGQAWDD